MGPDLTKDLLRPRPDPYPLYRELREAGPAHWSDAQQGWVLTRHADVVAVLRDVRFSSDPKHSRAVQEMAFDDRTTVPLLDIATKGIMLFADPPDHTRLRGLVSKAFTPRRIEELRPRIQSIFDELLATAAERGTVDLLADLAYPLPVIVIAELMGAPASDREQLKEWSAPLARMIDPLVTMDEVQAAALSAMAFMQYLNELVEERRKQPRDDLLSAMVAAEDGETELAQSTGRPDRLEHGELISNAILLLIAGHETTTNLIGNGMAALFRHPAELDALRAEPALVKNAVEELLRYDGPVQLTARTALDDKVVAGQEVPAGERVITILGAANHDPAVFADPDRLDVRREEARHHVAFGNGIHFCLGAPLARAEAQIAIGTLLDRFPGVAPAVDVDSFAWRDSVTLRGLSSLPIDLGEPAPI